MAMKFFPPKISNDLKDSVAYYCKDCQKIVQVKPIGNKFAYTCAVCSTKNVAFGTEKSLRNFYHIKDASAKKELTEEEKKLINADKL